MSQGLASFEHRLRKPPLEHPRCHHIEHNGREKAHNGINQIMRLYVHRSPAQQQIKGSRQANKRLLPRHAIIIRMVDMPTCELGNAAVGRSPTCCELSTRL